MVNCSLLQVPWPHGPQPNPLAAWLTVHNLTKGRPTNYSLCTKNNSAVLHYDLLRVVLGRDMVLSQTETSIFWMDHSESSILVMWLTCIKTITPQTTDMLWAEKRLATHAIFFFTSLESLPSVHYLLTIFGIKCCFYRFWSKISFLKSYFSD